MSKNNDLLHNKRIHFIAIGGAVMHNLAICLHRLGNRVSGSDDMFFDPSKSNLAAEGILPETEGWHPERVDKDVDYLILGMHAKADNPELLRAQELGLTIYSFPAFIYAASQDKKRLVIAGSHGKTSITSMIMHVLKTLNKDFDYLVGAQLEGFDQMVQLSDAPIMIIEGDEYTTSPLDLRPKFLHYKHHIACISGIAWDHFNVYPTYDIYKDQFMQLIELTAEGGKLFYADSDNDLLEIIKNSRSKGTLLPYSAHEARVEQDQTILIQSEGETPIQVFGKHNLENLQVARLMLKEVGINDSEFYQAIQSFKGASKRLEIIGKNDSCIIFKDFAHAPSKLKATSTAVSRQFEKRTTVGLLELHTYSSLNPQFIHHYAHTFDEPEEAIVFISPKIMEKKGFDMFTEDQIKAAFQRQDILFMTSTESLEKHLLSHNWPNKNLLLMSSGNYAGLDLDKLVNHILS